MPASLLNGIAPPLNSFVLAKHKIVWIPVTKAASSSLRWMVADLVGEDFQRFYQASGAHQSRYMTIHTDRGVWQHAPRLNKIAPDELAEISRDNGWLIFTMIRDPWTRLWSAWQSKFLVQHTPYVRSYRDEPWFPRVPKTLTDVVDDWATFVTARPWETHELLKADAHFKTQFSSARPHGVNYSRIYDLTEMPALEADIHAHLSALGLDQELYMVRTNENPVPMPAEALENGLADIISASYASDMAEWGDRWDLDAIKAKLRPVPSEAVRSVDRVVAANERIGDLSKELKRAHKRVATLTASQSGATSTKSKPPPPAGDGATPVGFAELLRAYPWPKQPRYPDVEPAGRPARGFELVTEAAAASTTEHPVIVEIGAELGGSTRLSLAIPGSYVVSIDPWKERQGFGNWPELTQFNGVRQAAFDLFRSFNFEYRDRLVALRDSAPHALTVVHDAGLRPDIVYLDADRRTDAVLRDITVTAALFPEAIICGAGWAWQPKRNAENYDGVARPVRAAVTRWAGFRDHFVETHENTWRLDASRKFNLDDDSELRPRSDDDHAQQKGGKRSARAAAGKLQSTARRALNRDR